MNPFGSRLAQVGRLPGLRPALLLALSSALLGGEGAVALDGMRGSDTEDSPAALAITQDGSQVFIACATANEVACFDLATTSVTRRIEVPAAPLGLALSPDGRRLYAACASPSSTVCVIDVAQRRVVDRIAAGHTATALVVSPDGQRLYVCNRFDDDVSVIDLVTGRETGRIRVEREPVAAAITPDGRYLVVANHLHAGPADDLHAQAVVSIVDTEAGRVAKNVHFSLGAALLRGVAISPDGRIAAVTFVHARFWLSTTEVALGRMNGNAVAFLDLHRQAHLGMLFLDQTTRGAANPWAVAWTPDGKTVAVTLAGTHEVCLIDAPVDADPANFPRLTLASYFTENGRVLSPPKHPVRVRQRASLPGNGPRALAAAGSQLFVANYFSDDLCRIDLSAPSARVESWPLGPSAEPQVRDDFHVVPGKMGTRCNASLPDDRGLECSSVPGSGLEAAHETGGRSLAVAARLEAASSGSPSRARQPAADSSSPCASDGSGEASPKPGTSLARRGEMLFNDARLCLEGWQSCASCHDTDGRVDAFNWDLLNDGLANPKNTKSLLWAHRTPPAMSLGVRASAGVAVRAGIHHILFSDSGEEVAAAIDAYLQTLAPVPSPRLVHGRLSEAARRGERIYLSARTGCATCHPPPLFTDLESYDVGTAAAFRGLWDSPAGDKPSDRFDTPALVELWRSAPYLHNGCAATLKEVLTTKNREDRHGRTSHLSQDEIEDLVEYLLSL